MKCACFCAESPVAQIVSINFSAGDIRVVVATLRGSFVHVERTYCFSDQEFEEFLSLDSSESYVASVNCAELFQDIIHIPPASEKFVNNLVRAEIQKLHPDLADYAYFYEIIGETLYEGKLFKKVACFIYASNDLIKVISRFTRYRKRIKHLYSSSYALSRLVINSADDVADSMLCISGFSGEKCIFLLENRHLYFVRHIQSDAEEIDERDVQNINMTIDHCFQSLRVKPRCAVYLGSEEVLKKTAPGVLLPLQREFSFKEIAVAEDILWEFAAPIGALLCLTTPSSGDMLPQGYVEQSFAMGMLRFGACLLGCLSLFVLVGAGMKAYCLAELQNTIAGKRAALRGVDHAMAEYARINDELVKVSPMIASINRAAAQVDQQDAFIALGCFSSPRIHPTSIILKQKDGNEMSIEVKGELKGGSYSEMQADYERLIASVKRSGKLAIVSRKMDPVARSFNFELFYKGQFNGPA